MGVSLECYTGFLGAVFSHLIQPSHTTPRYISKTNEDFPHNAMKNTHARTYTIMVIVTLQTRLGQLISPLRDACINMWYSHPTAYCQPKRMNETWKTWKNTTKGEGRQSQMAIYIVWFHLYELSQIGKSIETESWLVVAPERGCVSPSSAIYPYVTLFNLNNNYFYLYRIYTYIIHSHLCVHA